MSIVYRQVGGPELTGLGADVVDALKKQVDSVGKKASVMTDKAGNVIAAVKGDDPLKALLAGGKLTVTTNFSPPATIDAASLFASDRPSNKPAKGADFYAKMVQPTFVLESPVFGRQVIAPGGTADPNAWKRYAALAALGLGGAALFLFFLGRWSK